MEMWAVAFEAHPPTSLIGFRRTNVTEYDSSVISRLWKKVDKNGPIPSYRPELGPCWIWSGTLNAYGYGVINVNYKIKQCHRVSYELAKGEIPAGLTADHLCRVPTCVNPDHLEAVTRGINVLRGVAFSAINARKTHCNAGHPLTGDNLYVNGQPGRRCRACTLRGQRRRNYPELANVPVKNMNNSKRKPLDPALCIPVVI